MTRPDGRRVVPGHIRGPGRRSGSAGPCQASPSQGSEPPESLALARSPSGLRLGCASAERERLHLLPCEGRAKPTVSNKFSTKNRMGCLCLQCLCCSYSCFSASLGFSDWREGGGQDLRSFLRSFRLCPRLHARSCRFARGPTTRAFSCS